jgi:predicted  nucleic acid-binding Zn-ribbon protein
MMQAESETKEVEGSKPSPTPAPSSSQEKKSASAAIQEIFQNAMQATGLCCFKTKERAIIQKLEIQIINRQKKFGVEYLTMIGNQASQEELKECVTKAMKDTHDLQTEIEQHNEAIDEKQEAVTGEKRKPTDTPTKSEDNADNQKPEQPSDTPAN